MLAHMAAIYEVDEDIYTCECIRIYIHASVYNICLYAIRALHFSAFLILGTLALIGASGGKV
jgi:hypothetical protein